MVWLLVLFMFVFYLCCSFEYICFLFFFFKQKTAYEMRISDWSSDVCSSDLEALASEGDAFLAEGFDALGGDLAGFDERFDVRLVEFDGFQIGRASCRERVCQYV